jgi:uncharacterized glyoxalase superfamily protein PhnB
MKEAYFIIYVTDQRQSADFYRKVLGREPIIDVPGITEFPLRDGTILGVMPVTSAAKLIGATHFSESTPQRAPKSELYLVVEDPGSYHARALANGATELSPMQERDWGHRAAYSLDPNGHVLAFAEKISSKSTA